MKRGNRVFYQGILNHCYQRTVGNVLIFYNISDFLVCFTIFCVEAGKHDVKVLAVSLMPDHIHHSTIALRRDALTKFVQSYSSKFTHAHNAVCHRKGPLFESPFGSAPKVGGKKARTNLVYVGNNAPERHLCQKAEEYRWNFLAYYKNPHPFSEPLSLHTASWRMKKAVHEVNYQCERSRPMTYAQLQRLFNTLDDREKLQLVDYIVTSYNVIDYESAIRFFDSYGDMLSAMHANTGSEYDLNEVFKGRSDACYARLTQIILKETDAKDIHEILSWPEEKKLKLMKWLAGRTEATLEQLIAYFHLHSAMCK